MLSSQLQKILIDNGYTSSKQQTKNCVSSFVSKVLGLGKAQDASYEHVRLALDLELAFRLETKCLLEKENQSNNIYNLISFAGNVALTLFASDTTNALDAIQMKKIPFILLEDVLEGETVYNLDKSWNSIVIPLTPLLTNPILFSIGKNILLRCCNSLLRRLSRACHTELCGRVKMFLATSFDLNDKSAVNLSGKYNMFNVTNYEIDSERYEYLLMTKTNVNANANTNTNTNTNIENVSVDVNATTENGMVISNEDDAAIINHHHGDNDNDNDNDNDDLSVQSGPLSKYSLVLENNKGDADEDKDKEGSTSTVSHEDYKKFWELQEILKKEPKMIISTSTSKDELLKMLQSCKDAITLMNAWKANPSSEVSSTSSDSNTVSVAIGKYTAAMRKATKADAVVYNEDNGESSNAAVRDKNTLKRKKQHLNNSNNNNNNNSNNNNNDDDDICCNDNDNDNGSSSGQHSDNVKFLTAPDLLPLQLRNPIFRQQVAIQILIACQSLRLYQRSQTRKALEKENENVVGTKTVPASTTDKTGEDARNSLQPRSFEKWLSGQLHFIESRCLDIISVESNGDGSGVGSVVDGDGDGRCSGKRNRNSDVGNISALMVNRVLWGELQWIEWKAQQCPSLAREAIPVTITSSEYNDKTTTIESTNTSTSSGSNGESFYFHKSLENVKKSLDQLDQNVPTFQAHLEDYIDADDPANGIEEEYHPKHDPIYCWRARRLLAEKAPHAYLFMENGNISQGLKEVNNLPVLRSSTSTSTSTSTRTSSTRTDSSKEDDELESREYIDIKHVMPSPPVEVEVEVEAEESGVAEADANADADVGTEAMDIVAYPASSSASTVHEQGQQQNIIPCTFCVTEYGNSETQETLAEYFSQFGDIAELRLIKAKRTKPCAPKYALLEYDGDNETRLRITNQILGVGDVGDGDACVTKINHVLNKSNLIIAPHIKAFASASASVDVEITQTHVDVDEKGRDKNKQHLENGEDGEVSEPSQPPTKRRRN